MNWKDKNKLFFVLIIISLFVFLTGCATTTTKLVSPITYKEELSPFSKQAESKPYQTYLGERLSIDKTAIIVVTSHMLATYKEGVGIHNLSINNYEIDFMKDINKRPQCYQLEILAGQNRLEASVKWLSRSDAIDSFEGNKLTFNAKAGAIYFLQIFENKDVEPNPFLDFVFNGPFALEALIVAFATYPLWFWAVDDVDAGAHVYDDTRCLWIWDTQTEKLVAGSPPSGWPNDLDSCTK